MLTFPYTLTPPAYRQAILRLLRALYLYETQAENKYPEGIDLHILAPIDEIVQATYMLLGVPPQVSNNEETGWDWGNTLFYLDQTDGSDEALWLKVEEIWAVYSRDSGCSIFSPPE